ncbi:tetratricopeptide repeat protein [Anabaena azotica]|uniref:Tetratricopeptide repeat protein n=1 Tax=Anabaena azotica FACHB-119 TaxID=947527 RepID=A0ABR8D1R4_9NOST|nr:tetratricopeptide repeat protein [Anabaena azotica]MBD2501129.1 tetratricopeptide repeat protein [Anabaena azotica FACHB-119]
MTNSYRPKDVAIYNERALTRLAWTIEASTGQFSLILAHCNYAHLRAELVERLQAICAINIRVIKLQESARTLYTTIREELREEQPQALMVLGLESVRDIEQVLISANHVREEFRKNFHFPLVLWVTDEIVEKLIRLAPDFESWTTTTDFAIATDTLIAELKQRVNNLFAKLFELGAEQFLTSEPIFSPGYRQETLIAWQELQCREQVIDPELQAGVDLYLGRNDYLRNRIEPAIKYYQKSLDFWQQTNQLERQGILLFHIGLCFSGLAEEYGTKKCFCWTEARHYFQKGIECFEQGERKDLVAKFINKLGEVLKNLEAWDDLQNLAQYSLELQTKYDHSIQLARAYGFLAEVALAKSQWTDTQKFAQTALEIANQVTFKQQRNQSLYLLLLAEAQQNLGQNLEAIVNLEKARNLGIQDNPLLYIHILNTLRTLYFEQKQYLQAFRIKKESRSVQQQYRLRAFVGAGRLKPIPENQPGFTQTEREALIKQEIESFGRDKAVDDLVERVASTQYKLTVVYGQSGVGKSSMLEAGLMPTLAYKTIGTHDVLPVSTRFYTNWVQELNTELGNALTKAGIETSLTSDSDFLEEILEQLRQNEQHNLLTVLIFDQFEEFFFVCDRSEHERFFEFFRNSLNQPFVKVLVSLREDYLHLLLRGSRKLNLDVINNNILDKQILYYVGNFLPEEAKSIILSLTERAHFDLEPELVDELVSELARDVGEVRPIELQIVGDQLQTDNITTLSQYREWGPNPKEVLAERYLEDVVADCGLENKKVAALILYLLTSENNTRPLKTRAELEKDLTELATELAAEPSKLDLVLRIFVESGLVFLLKESPADRYQLVHDYLVTFIRHQQEPKIKELITKLEEEREQRLQAEAELKQTEAAKQIAEAELKQTETAKQIAEAQIQQANTDLEQAKANIQVTNQKAKRHTQLGLAVLACSLVLATGATLEAIHQGKQAKVAEQEHRQAHQQATIARKQQQQTQIEVRQKEDAVRKAEENLKYMGLINNANILQQEGRYTEALDILYLAIKRNPKNPFAFAVRGQTHSNMERYEEAIDDLQRAIKLDPKQAFLFGQLGEIYHRKESYDKALANFNQAIKFDPKNPWLISRRGETYRMMKRNDQALADLNFAIKLDPKSALAIANRGETYRMMGRYDDALSDLNLAIKLDPKFTWAIANRGVTYHLIGRYDEALSDLNFAIVNQNLAWAIASRGETYRMMGRYNEALADLNLVIKLDPKFTWAIANRGETYSMMGRYDQALADFNYALKLSPQSDWIIYNRGLAYQALGKIDKSKTDLATAIQLARKAYQSNPQKANDFRNGVNLAIYYVAAGNTEQSEKFYREVISKNIPKYILREAIRDLDDFLMIFPNHAQAHSMRELLKTAL